MTNFIRTQWIRFCVAMWLKSCFTETSRVWAKKAHDIFRCLFFLSENILFERKSKFCTLQIICFLSHEISFVDFMCRRLLTSSNATVWCPLCTWWCLVSRRITWNASFSPHISHFFWFCTFSTRKKCGWCYCVFSFR